MQTFTCFCWIELSCVPLSLNENVGLVEVSIDILHQHWPESQPFCMNMLWWHEFCKDFQVICILPLHFAMMSSCKRCICVILEQQHYTVWIDVIKLLSVVFAMTKIAEFKFRNLLISLIMLTGVRKTVSILARNRRWLNFKVFGF